jgi:hypothetical protein
MLATAALAAVTFYGDVLPILQRRCQLCHRPGEIAPMSLLTYQQARPWARAMRQAVLTRKMPPWFAAAASQPFSNDAHLSPEEIDVIDRWASTGAAAGDAGKAPQSVAWPNGWNIEAPDVVVRMPQSVHVPAKEELDYQFIILPLSLSEDRWAKSVEIRPGARGVVHHVVAYIREPGSDWLRDAPKGKPFVQPGVTRSDILAVYAPGQPPMECLPGMAKKVPAGSDLVLQMHYTPSGRAVDDRTSVGIVWAQALPERRVLTLQLATTNFHIPPGDANYRVSVSGTLPNNALLLSMFPHMHLRGKAFEYALVESGGHIDTLLRVAPYNFSWQLDYRLAVPRLLKKGARLMCTAWYDNSPNNPRNPDPTEEVGYGEQSRDEMMVGFFDVAVPVDIDKRSFFVR